MTFAVRFSRQARDQLLDLDAYLAEAASPGIAAGYTDALVDYCCSFAIFPERGTRRDDIRPGLRITNFHGRAAIAFVVDVEARSVTILGVYQAGRDYENRLGDSVSDSGSAVASYV